MNITNHAKLRSKQRGIPEDIFSLILQFETVAKDLILGVSFVG